MRVATLADKQTRSLWVDADLCPPGRSFPRERSLRGEVVYVDDSVTDPDLTRRMRPGDTAFGGRPGVVSVLRVGVQGGSYYLVRASAWGCETRDPSKVARRLTAVQEAWEELAGTPLPRTAGAAARQILTRHGCVGEPLPPRWRGLAASAIHGGPVVCVAGGGPDVVCADVSGAYRRAMMEPVPVVGSLVVGGRSVRGRWVSPVDRSWAKIRKSAGIVEASVHVHGPDGVGAIPALPVDGPDGGIWHPTGIVRGVWQIAHIREAEERGEVAVYHVWQAMVATVTYPTLRPAIDDIDRFPDTIRKSLYCRAYGMLASRGGWEGSTLRAGEMPTWVSRQVEPRQWGGPPTLRPDLAAWITSDNQRRVFRALRSLDERRTVAVHVDSIWTADTAGAERLGEEWRPKARGRVRYQCSGVYTVDGPEEDDGPPPERPTDGGRVWVDAASWERADAVSCPPMATVDGGFPLARTCVAHPSVSDPRWSPSGAWRPMA